MSGERRQHLLQLYFIASHMVCVGFVIFLSSLKGYLYGLGFLSWVSAYTLNCW
ncbi:hypothetical protein AtNW77_Chr3g0196331 [Arabidopsis thaliana]